MGDQLKKLNIIIKNKNICKISLSGLKTTFYKFSFNVSGSFGLNCIKKTS